MKKVLMLLLLVISYALHTFAYDLYIDGIYYDANVEKGELTVTWGENKYNGAIYIPSIVNYKGKTFIVRKIGDNAFYKSNILSITMSDSIKEIGSAFYECKQLSKVKLSNNLETIDNSAFEGCTSLGEIIIPSSVTSIDYRSFSDTGLKKVVFNDGSKSLLIKMSLLGFGANDLPFSGSCIQYVYLGRNINCDALTNLYSYGVLFGGTVKKLIIGPQVSHIESQCTRDMNVEALTIPATLSSIESIDMPNLKRLIIKDSDKDLQIGSISQDSKNIKYLYIGRNLDTYRDLFNFYGEIDTLIMGLHFNDIKPIRGLKFTSDINNIFIYNSSWASKFQRDYSNFTSKTYLNGILHVPSGTVDKFKNAVVWKNFCDIREISSYDNDNNAKKCATPEIYYSNGKLSFTCETPDVEYISSIEDNDIGTHSSDIVSLCVTYNIKVYTTKPGYENSDIANATLCWIDVNPRSEGTVNNIIDVKAKPILITNRNGAIVVTGAEDGTKISVFGANGILLGSSTSHNNTAAINTSMPRGSVAIIKVGNQSIKLLIK